MSFVLSCFNTVFLCTLVNVYGVFVAAFRMNNVIYYHDTTFDGRLPTEVTQWTPADSALQCGRLCQDENWCNSFFYNHGTKSCALQRMVYVSLQTSPAFGWKYYRLTSAWCPAKRDYVIDRVTATCYRLVTSPVPSWSAARAACDVSDEMLVVLEPVEKASFVHDFLNTNIALHNFKDGIFIGASRPLPEWDTPVSPSGPSFVWVNGQPLDLNATQPFWRDNPTWNKPSRNLVVLKFMLNYRWGLGIDSERFYICERKYA